MLLSFRSGQFISRKQTKKKKKKKKKKKENKTKKKNCNIVITHS